MIQYDRVIEMAERYHIGEKQVAEIEAARRRSKSKNVEKRLRALLLYAQGTKRAEIGERVGFAAAYVGELVSKYRKGGLEAIVENHYPGNHRNMSFEEEAALLEPYLERMKAGEMVDVKEILADYEAKLGRSTEKDHGRIYQVLERHGIRKVMPRPKHPNQADEATVEASKKLTVR